MKRIALITVMALALNVGLTLAHTPPAPAGDAPTDGKALVAQRCASCHGLGRVDDHIGKKDAAWWTATVERMIAKGARLDDAQKALVIKHLVGAAAGSKPMM